MNELRPKPGCEKCGGILLEEGDVLYCSKCDYKRPKTEEERTWLWPLK